MGFQWDLMGLKGFNSEPLTILYSLLSGTSILKFGKSSLSKWAKKSSSQSA